MLLTPSCKSSLPQLEALIPAHRQQSAATTPESLEYCAIMQRLLDQLDRRAPGGPISSLETPKRADARLPDGASDEEVDVIAPENPDSPDHASSEDQDVADATKQSSSRKTEQNRRAQKRYRRRKKEMFEELQRKNVQMQMDLQWLLQHNNQTQARASLLEQVIDLKDRGMLDSANTAGSVDAGMVDFAEGMLELVQVLHVEQDVASTTQLLLRATADLMAGQDDSMSFVRKGLIVQLDSCLISLDQQQGPAAHSRICQLMEAYVAMIRRAAAGSPHTLLTYLALPLQSDIQRLPKVLLELQLRPDQEHQLREAHAAFLTLQTQLAEERQPLTAALQTTWPGAECQTRSLASINKGQTAVESWQQSLLKEKQNLADFYTLAILVLDPIQHARAMVASYPAAVDMLALCALLADQSGLSRSTGLISERTMGLPSTSVSGPGYLSPVLQYATSALRQDMRQLDLSYPPTAMTLGPLTSPPSGAFRQAHQMLQYSPGSRRGSDLNMDSLSSRGSAAGLSHRHSAGSLQHAQGL